MDFNNAKPQQSFDLIPRGTLLKVRMTVKPGGYDDPALDLTGGYATQSNNTGSIYLSCEAVALDGPYAKRKVWFKIGLSSPNGPTWGEMGKSLILGILNSARNLHPQDKSEQAQQARRIESFGDLDGIEFVARVDVEKDANGVDRNVVNRAIEPDHKEYAALMGVIPQKNASGQNVGAAPAQDNSKPAWAK